MSENVVESALRPRRQKHNFSGRESQRKGENISAIDHYESFVKRLNSVIFSSDFLLLFSWLLLFTFILYFFHSLLAPLFTAWILAYLLNPMVVFWHRKIPKIKRSGAVLLVLSKIFLLGFLFFIPFTLTLTTNIVHMANEISAIDYQPIITKAVSQVKELRQKLPDQVHHYADEFLKNIDQYQANIEAVVKKVNSWVGMALKSIGNLLMSSGNLFFKKTLDIFLVLVLLFYLLFDFHHLYPRFLKIVPSGYRKWTDRFFSSCDQTLKSFVRGQLIVACIFGLMMSLGLFAIGIKFWLVIGPLAGIANLIPYLGIIFGLGPAFILAIYQGAIAGSVLWMLAKVLILFAIVQFLDGFVVQPKVVGESVELHPLVIILSLLVGSEIMGVYGMIFAVPVAAVLKVLMTELYQVFYENRSGFLHRSGTGR